MSSRYWSDRMHCPTNKASIAASSTYDTPSVDTAGALLVGALIIVHAGDKTLDAKWRRDDNSGLSSPTDVAATGGGSVALSQIGSGTPSGLYCMELTKPAERYVSLRFTTGSGGSANREVTVIFYLMDRHSPSAITVSTGFAQEVYGQEEL